jgi:hypothetical protein
MPVPLVLELVPEAVLVLATPPLPPCEEDEADALLDDASPPPLVAEEVVSPPLEQAAVIATTRQASEAAARRSRLRTRERARFLIADDSTRGDAPRIEELHLPVKSQLPPGQPTGTLITGAPAQTDWTKLVI